MLTRLLGSRDVSGTWEEVERGILGQEVVGRAWWEGQGGIISREGSEVEGERDRWSSAHGLTWKLLNLWQSKGSAIQPRSHQQLSRSTQNGEAATLAPWQSWHSRQFTIELPLI